MVKTYLLQIGGKYVPTEQSKSACVQSLARLLIGTDMEQNDFFLHSLSNASDFSSGDCAFSFGEG